MSRISREMAESIAVRESNKKYDEKITEAEQSLKKLLTDKVKKKYPVPEIIMKAIKETGWIRHESSVKCNLGGERWTARTWEMTESWPVEIHNTLTLDPTEDIKNKYQKLENLKEERTKFKREVQEVILGLGTPKRVLEQVPELKPYFENMLVKSTALVPIEQIKKVRSQLVKA